MNTVWHMPTPRSLADVEAWMGKKDHRKVAHNTYINHLEQTGGLNVGYHGNSIITYYPDSILVAHRGWPTSTTCDRFRHLLPFQAYRKSTRIEVARYPGEPCFQSQQRMIDHNRTASIFVAGIELPENGSAIAFTWEGERV